MEGKKAYILPALAAAVLGLLLVLRPDTSQEDPAEAPPASPTPPPVATAGVKATIRAALAEAPDTPLSESAQTGVRETIGGVVERCRASRPETASTDVTMSVDVIAARDVGTRIDAVHLGGGLPPSLAGCVREGVLGSKPPDAAETGRATWRLEFDAP